MTQVMVLVMVHVLAAATIRAIAVAKIVLPLHATSPLRVVHAPLLPQVYLHHPLASIGSSPLNHSPMSQRFLILCLTR